MLRSAGPLCARKGFAVVEMLRDSPMLRRGVCLLGRSHVGQPRRRVSRKDTEEPKWGGVLRPGWAPQGLAPDAPTKQEEKQTEEKRC